MAKEEKPPEQPPAAVTPPSLTPEPAPDGTNTYVQRRLAAARKADGK
jgi:hypothetical protein